MELARGLEVKVEQDIVDAFEECKARKHERGKKQLIPVCSKKVRIGNAGALQIRSRSGNSVGMSVSVSSDHSYSVNQAKGVPSSTK